MYGGGLLQLVAYSVSDFWLHTNTYQTDIEINNPISHAYNTNASIKFYFVKRIDGFYHDGG